jgi:hypothetical protein
LNTAIIKREPEYLDSPSEALLIMESEGYSNSNFGAFSLCGPCDVQAFDQALREAQADFPNFHANLVPCRQGLWTVWGWRRQAGPVPLEVHDLTSLPEAPADMEAWIQAEMTPWVQQVQNLQRTNPVRLHLYLFPGERQMFVFQYNHVATDGGGFYNFLAAALRIYHRLVTGREPDWAGVSAMHAQAGAAQPITPIPFGRFLREMFGELRKYPPWRIVQLASRPTPPSSRKVVRCVIDDPALQKAWRDRARRDGGSVADLFLAASKLALDAFNEARGADHEIMLHGLAVNQRLRQRPEESAGQTNSLGGIGISSNAADRRDPAVLLQRVIAERKRKLDSGYDFLIGATGRWVSAVGRILPLAIRGRALRPLIDMRLSFVVTNLGVVWPRMENGRPTGETAICEAGRMRLLDVHNSTGSPRGSGGTLILRTFLDRLYLVFSFGRDKATDEDARAYARLVLDHAQRYL